MWGLLYPQPYLAGGRRTEICWSMGTKTFTVFEGIPQDCISGFADEGRLNSYLADIEEQVQDRFEKVVEQMKQAQGITEQLKSDNVWEWVGRMNNIQACARKIVDKEIIYQ